MKRPVRTPATPPESNAHEHFSHIPRTAASHGGRLRRDPRSAATGALVRIRHVSPPQFVLSIGLLARGNDRTLVNWEQAFADAQVAERVRHIVEPSNEQNLDRLTAELSAA